jgi:suppressor of cytokine signaling 6/7
VDKEYGHAVAPNTCSVTLTCDTLTVHVSSRDCPMLKSTDAVPSCSSATANAADVLASDAGAASALNIESLQVVPPAQPFYDQVKETGPKGWSLSKELFRLSKYGWYWGPITRVEAEEKLTGQPDGAFLVRDSSDDHYLLSLSFRSYGRTLHTRIEHCNGVFSFYAQPESEGYSSIVDLIEHSMNDSQSGVFCYSRARMPGSPSFPVRLARPVSRFAQVRTLQYLCRFCIRQYTRVDHIQQLPLPSSIKGWLEEGQY